MNSKSTFDYVLVVDKREELVTNDEQEAISAFAKSLLIRGPAATRLYLVTHEGPMLEYMSNAWVVIFKPGTASVGNQLESWSEVTRVINSLSSKSAVTVLIDDSLAPAVAMSSDGTLDCTNRQITLSARTTRETRLALSPDTSLKNLHSISGNLVVSEVAPWSRDNPVLEWSVPKRRGARGK